VPNQSEKSANKGGPSRLKGKKMTEFEIRPRPKNRKFWGGSGQDTCDKENEKAELRKIPIRGQLSATVHAKGPMI